MTLSKHKCRKAMLRVCHCIVVGHQTFRPCCGWYCDTCGGRLNETGQLQVQR